MQTDGPSLRWDIFCRVIDNFGDVGVCWRLCRDLATRGQQVRLWLDHTEALHWMAPGALDGRWAGIDVAHWPTDSTADQRTHLPRSEVWIEAFGCEPPQTFIAQQRALWPEGKAPVWINLEYLSAEPYVERMHRLPSPLMTGPAQGWTRWFFYPGFTLATGGLLREPHLIERIAVFDRHAWRMAARHSHATPVNPSPSTRRTDRLDTTRWISLFCYEPVALPQLLEPLAQDRTAALLVTPGRATAATRDWLGSRATPSHWQFRPFVDQDAFDDMLWACDLNFVRGEDSLVRALWAGNAFVWQIYPQHDDAHHGKLEAFLDWLEAPTDLRHAHLVWNGIVPGSLPDLCPSRLHDWAEVTLKARERLTRQEDLTTGLRRFVADVAARQ